MIVGDLKPLAEIVSAIKEYKQVLVLGCGSCVTVCLSGGEKEAEQLSRELSQIRHYQGRPPQFEIGCILRQCEQDLVAAYQDIPAGTDAILSLACGAGVQTVADAVDPLPVIPALNTTFLGASAKPGIWAEVCRGCGECEEHCQFSAIALVDGVSHVTFEECMGCGICVSHCTNDAIELVLAPAKGIPMEMSKILG